MVLVVCCNDAGCCCIGDCWCVPAALHMRWLSSKRLRPCVHWLLLHWCWLLFRCLWLFSDLPIRAFAALAAVASLLVVASVAVVYQMALLDFASVVIVAWILILFEVFSCHCMGVDTCCGISFGVYKFGIGG